MIWLLFVACGPVFKMDKAPLCGVSADYGVTAHLVNGQRNGSFDYVPARVRAQQTVGFFNLTNGDLYWQTFFDHEHSLVETWNGVGMVWTDGDVDILAQVTQETEYTQQSWEHREIRLGCDVNIRRDFGNGNVSIEEGTLASTGYAYTRSWVDGFEWSALGVAQADGSYEEEIDITRGEDSFVSLESLNNEGLWSITYDYRQYGDREDGTFERSFDGVETADFFQRIDNIRYDWSWTKDLSGNGEGEFFYSGGTCAVKWVDGECRLRGCSNDADKGDCWF